MVTLHTVQSRTPFPLALATYADPSGGQSEAVCVHTRPQSTAIRICADTR